MNAIIAESVSLTALMVEFMYIIHVSDLLFLVRY